MKRYKKSMGIHEGMSFYCKVIVRIIKKNKNGTFNVQTLVPEMTVTEKEIIDVK